MSSNDAQRVVEWVARHEGVVRYLADAVRVSARDVADEVHTVFEPLTDDPLAALVRAVEGLAPLLEASDRRRSMRAV